MYLPYCGFSAEQKCPVDYFFSPIKSDRRLEAAIAEYLQGKFCAAGL
jgi:hypothetical protein